MHIAVFGLNHKTSPLELRESLYITDYSILEFLSELKLRGIKESVVLSTCNRTEIYFYCTSIEESYRTIKEILRDRYHINPLELEGCTYILEDENAYRHLFLVAGGLDSMVVGEPQILGQVKDAYRLSTDHNNTGFITDRIFHKAFNVAKRIRAETRIGYNPVSISSIAVELSKKIFFDLNKKKILVIGAGEMCEIALKQFKKENINKIFIVNRSFDRACMLAEETLGTAYPFDEMPSLLTQADMILSSTGSEKPIVDGNLVNTAMKKRKGRPLFFIDIAFPRDIDPSVNDIENVYLYNIDDLKELSQEYLSDRIREAQKAQIIIEEEVEKFSHWFKQLDKNPLIKHIIEKAEKIRSSELNRFASKFQGVDEATLGNIDMITKSVINKLLHRHITVIRENGDPAVLDVLKKIFEYDDEKESVDHRNKR